MCHFYVMKKKTALAVVVLLIAMLIGSVVFASTTLYTIATEDAEGIALPILMYHSVLKDPKASGKFVVSPDTFEKDLKFLKDNGYSTIFTAQLIDYVHNDVPLPDKPVMITLDDGYLNNLTYVVPLLEQYDMKAVISVVGSFTERFSKEEDHNPSYSHFSWDDINQAVASGHIEIGNHTYNMHSTSGRKGCMKKKGESDDQYQKILEEDLKKTQDLIYENCGFYPVVFAYPYGYISNASTDVVKKMGFQASFGCYERVNHITKDPERLYQLCRFNRPSGISTEKFMEKIFK